MSNDLTLFKMANKRWWDRKGGRLIEHQRYTKLFCFQALSSTASAADVFSSHKCNTHLNDWCFVTRPPEQQGVTFNNAEPGPAPELSDCLNGGAVHERRHISALNASLKDIFVGHYNKLSGASIICWPKCVSTFFHVHSKRLILPATLSSDSRLPSSE